MRIFILSFLFCITGMAIEIEKSPFLNYTIRCDDGNGYALVTHPEWIKTIDLACFCNTKRDWHLTYFWNNTYFEIYKKANPSDDYRCENVPSIGDMPWLH